VRLEVGGIGQQPARPQEGGEAVEKARVEQAGGQRCGHGLIIGHGRIVLIPKRVAVNLCGIRLTLWPAFRHIGEMKRGSSIFTVAIALLLSVQWATAFAHCLAPLGLAPQGLAPFAGSAGGHSIEICSANGVSTLVIGENGEPQEQPGSPTHKSHDSCPLCPGGAAPGPEAPAVAGRTLRYFAATHATRMAGLPPAPARAPPQQPRAPPIA
jgi:hypothetical protein